MENRSTLSSKDDEIDLLLLVESFISFMRRYAAVFISCIILFAGLFLLYYLNSSRLYTSRLILHSEQLTNSEQIEIVKNWNNFLKKNKPGLAVVLNTEVSILDRVAGLKAFEIQKLFVNNNPNGFYIDATVKDMAALPALQEALVYGFENNEYAKQRLAVRRDNLRQLIIKVSSEIATLDSLRFQIENIVSNRQTNRPSLILDVSNVNRQIITMNEELLSYNETLKFARAVQVLQSFSNYPSPKGPGLLPLLALGVITGIVFGYIISLLLSLNSKLKSRRLAEARSK